MLLCFLERNFRAKHCLNLTNESFPNSSEFVFRYLVFCFNLVFTWLFKQKIKSVLTFIQSFPSSSWISRVSNINMSWRNKNYQTMIVNSTVRDGQWFFYVQESQKCLRGKAFGGGEHQQASTWVVRPISDWRDSCISQREQIWVKHLQGFAVDPRGISSLQAADNVTVKVKPFQHNVQQMKMSWRSLIPLLL